MRRSSSDRVGGVLRGRHPVRERRAARSRRRRAAAGHHVLVEADRIVEVSDRPIRANDVQRLDARGRTLMPGLIDAHVHATITTHESRSHAGPSRNAGCVRGGSRARGDAAPRLHHGARRGRRGLGARGGRRRGLVKGPAAVLLRPHAVANGRARRLPTAQRRPDAVRVPDPLERLRPRRRWRRCGAQGGARGAAPRRDAGEDHGVGRGRFAFRSDLEPPVFDGGAARDRRRGACLAHLRDGARLHGRGDLARGRGRRAHDRARQPDRRARRRS